MNGYSNRLTTAVLLCLVLALPARAEPLLKTVVRWGLIGSWSRDCSLPPDRGRGALLSYEIKPNGRVAHRRNFGGVIDENEVVAASTGSDGVLNLRVFFPSFKQTREFGLLKQPDGSIRAIYNRDRKGKYSIKDGRFVDTRELTPMQHKCADDSV
jgi:hypothetical protein